MVVGHVTRLIRLISLLRSTNQALSANQLAAQLRISGQHDEVRMFKPARIVELEPTEEDFAPFAFAIEDYMNDAWGIIPGDRKYDVAIDFAKRVTSNVTEVQWPRTQPTMVRPDGSCPLRFHVNGLQELKWWVFGFADQAVVCERAEL